MSSLYSPIPLAPTQLVPPGAPAPVVYCSDEDLACRCPGDWWTLCPAWQQLAVGSDGEFAATDLWTLTSESVDFAGQGITVGAIINLSAPRPPFRGTGFLYAVTAVAGVTADPPPTYAGYYSSGYWGPTDVGGDSLAAGSITLRQIGQAGGVGQPPAPIGGLTGVQFEIRTFGPQILSATLDVKHRAGIDENLAVRSSPYLYDPNLNIRQLTVMTVLQRQYANECRTDRGDFALKLRQVEQDLSEAWARFAVKWGNLGQGEAPHTMGNLRVRR